MPVILPLVLQSVWPACLPFRPPQGLAGLPWVPGCWPPPSYPQSSRVLLPLVPRGFCPSAVLLLHVCPLLFATQSFLHLLLTDAHFGGVTDLFAANAYFTKGSAELRPFFFLLFSTLLLLFCSLTSPDLHVASPARPSDLGEDVCEV